MSDEATFGAGCFWGGEDHHQQYLARHGASCSIHGS